MARPASATVATPGVASSAPAAEDISGDAAMVGAAALNDGPAEAGAQTAPGSVTLSRDELQAMLSQAAAQGAAAVHRAAAPRASQPEDLPDQSEIDPAKITSPTLSKQGYVVPLNYGEPANPAIKR